MHVWINGPFGVGKSSTAAELVRLAPGRRIFDAESVGYMLRANLAGCVFDDFQDLPAWRTLVPAVAHEVIRHTGDDLIVVQTVLDESYWRELKNGFATRALGFRHIVLDATAEALRARIQADEDYAIAAQWRLDHIAAYCSARSWMLADADAVIDVTARSPKAAAEQILTSSGAN